MRWCALAVALCLGCAATPYQPAEDGGEGYSDWPIGRNRFHVEVVGNRHTDATTLRKYFYTRAQELCASVGASEFDGEPQTSEGSRTTGVVVGRGWMAARSHIAYVVYGDVKCTSPAAPAIAQPAPP